MEVWSWQSLPIDKSNMKRDFYPDVYTILNRI